MKQVIRKKKSKSALALLRCKKGQAVVEYVLILIITITMLLSLRGAFKSIDDFMYSYMGAYVSCLMEYGELPARGVETSELKNNKDGGSGGGKVCNSKFGGFTLNGGIQENKNSSTGGSKSFGQSSSKNSSQSAAAEANSKVAENKKSSSESTSSESSSGKNSSSSYAGGRIRRSSNAPGTGTADNGSNSADASKTKVLEDEDGTGGSRRGSGEIRSTRVIHERSRYKAITGKLADDLDKKSKAARAPTSRTLAKVDEGYRFGPRQNIFTPPEIKAASISEDDNSGFQFGNILKWVIIAGMAITIFIFFGNQVMGFMKSKEK